MKIILVCLLAYLIGSIPWALIIGKVFFNKDIRTMGSGNLGTTNMIRNLGKKAGMFVFFLDISKSILSMFIAAKVLGDVNYLSLFGAFAMLGHIFPLFAGFKGGKAVATGSGIFIYLYPVLALVLVLIFFINLFVTGYVSLGSIIISIVGAIGVFFIGQGFDKYIMIIMCILVVYMHKSNIVRLKNGTENVSKMKINFKK
ncbi:MULTISPECIES: glycerol-3-phosphate 1-O-acyltransferase PlsY [unclassified Gemella]|uniref:glycerol-3-phosphate 1-O-acyltransferase PlsY n=1 Tax=unclassified Gemella TaxID=2624949 RepID=UPI0010736B3C|nr:MULTISPECIES: glycerol-3-phosphate 1-O-acyltransferase PlsY [unclassified Gemella]MBF0709781.1 glycerol-3-phosphate 1-O-acyltransferase PlsY [Gemella sp. GL1.1]MBF0747131.1 glycerol-3-phosphate 1-O-acyltransferase PlsY [Gemella sp. 19428wG2_WT2a]NYS27125.1 glycerol-3-phosphate 1-O-acyltransferase PlsY [Gemella sp. GL1]TFU58372.1 glycerol-3-phosphate 1-O-acyltransferase PlsY [Gemella sp. WT2a]